MQDNKPMLPTTLADRPIADRRGDDRLSRGANHVAHPADLELVRDVTQVGTEPAVTEESSSEE